MHNGQGFPVLTFLIRCTHTHTLKHKTINVNAIIYIEKCFWKKETRRNNEISSCSAIQNPRKIPHPWRGAQPGWEKTLRSTPPFCFVPPRAPSSLSWSNNTIVKYQRGHRAGTLVDGNKAERVFRCKAERLNEDFFPDVISLCCFGLLLLVSLS